MPSKHDYLAFIAPLYQAEDISSLHSALAHVIKVSPHEGVRILTHFWHHIPWRSIQYHILSTIGDAIRRHDPGQRGLWFLIKIATDTEDLSMAREAILALGKSQHPAAAQYLERLLDDNNGSNVLKRDALISLALMPQHYIFANIRSIALNPSESIATRQAALLCLGRHRYLAFKDDLEIILVSEQGTSDGRLFNTALLVAGAIGQQSTIVVLMRLDLQQRVFADQLKENALARIRLRNKHAIEDIIASILLLPLDHHMTVNYDDKLLIDHLMLLREYPLIEVREAFFLLVDKPSVHLSAYVRMILCGKNWWQEDWEFILTNQKDLPLKLQAMMIHNLHKVTLNKKEDKKFLEQIDDPTKLSEWMIVPDYLEKTKEILEKNNMDEELLIHTINNFTLQVLMNPNLSKSGIDYFMKIAKSHQNHRLRGRCLRALGLPGLTDSRLPSFAYEMARKDRLFIRDAIFALGNSASKTAVEKLLLLCKRIKTDDFETMSLALQVFAQLGFIKDTDALLHFPEQILAQEYMSTLQILAHNQISAWQPLITASLNDKAWTTQLAALAAVQRNYSSTIEERVASFLVSSKPALQRRAVYALAQSRNIKAQKRVCDWAVQALPHNDLIEKFCADMDLLPGSDYAICRDLLQKLIKKISDRPGVSKTIDRITDLSDRMKDQMYLSNTSRFTSGSHGLDKSLAQSIKTYDQLSDPIKAAIRNAEVTFKNTKLFTKNVDRSTIIIELTKAIDILFQERLGELFGRSERDQHFVAMQSRVIELELDGRSQIDPVKTFDIVGFDKGGFPRHKLVTLAKAIADGRILHNPYRFLDGLRAWSLILLLFARRFRYQHYILQPILMVKSTDKRFIDHMICQLNDLQNLRNTSAHRGTITQETDLSQVRLVSFALLDDIALKIMSL